MSDKPSFTVVYECQDESEQPDIAVGYSGNDFSAFRLIVIGDGDFVQRYNYERELAERLQQQLTAANARVEALKFSFGVMESTALGPVDRMRETGFITVSYTAFCELAKLLEQEKGDE